MNSESEKSPDLLNYSFCTFFDQNYLARGFTLIESLRLKGDNAEILVICLDKITLDSLTPFSKSLRLNLVSLDKLLIEYPELSATRKSRSEVEFYFTCTPFVIKFSLSTKPDKHLVIYLDADLYFFESPQLIISQSKDHSVSIIPHNYPWFLKHLASRYGFFNVGLMVFKNDFSGNSVLNWWAQNCLAWCHDYPEAGKFADQGYLNDFYQISDGTKVLTHPGFNLAPWNTASNVLSFRNKGVQIDGLPLVFFHFHNLKQRGHRWFTSQVNYLSPLSRRAIKSIYHPYLVHLEKSELRFKKDDWNQDSISRRGVGFKGLLANLARIAFLIFSLLSGQTVKSRKLIS